MTELENLYMGLGGRFITPAVDIQKKLAGIKAFVFDWDGVFNNGQKTSTSGSAFSEVDSMGTNLLRYSHFLRHRTLPLVSVISGEKNDTALYFSKRESFHHSFYRVANKLKALEFLCEKEKLVPQQIAYFFDDVLDLSIAEVCGLRLMVNQKANPLFANYCIKNKLVDYLSASPGGQFAVREMSELLVGLNENYDTAIADRKNYSANYATYIEQKRRVNTDYYLQNQEQHIEKGNYEH